MCAPCCVSAQVEKALWASRGSSFRAEQGVRVAHMVLVKVKVIKCNIWICGPKPHKLPRATGHKSNLSACGPGATPFRIGIGLRLSSGSGKDGCIIGEWRSYGGTALDWRVRVEMCPKRRRRLRPHFGRLQSPHWLSLGPLDTCTVQ